MKRVPKYTDEPIGEIEILQDFLPPPDKLVMKEDGVKVTISLSRRSVEFFKAHAARSQVSYQRMIRSLLDGYASMYGKHPLASGAGGQRRTSKVSRRLASPLAGKPLDKSDYRRHLEEKYR
jgi:hypothetical protein